MQFGRLPARHDDRVPRFATLAPLLPPPPDQTDWGAAVEQWFMLANDQAGDCVVAAAMHFAWQQMRYKPPYRGPMPTDAEAIANYSAIGGYVQGDPTTDNGLYVQGPGGLMTYWLNNGIQCCGATNKIDAYVALNARDPMDLMQGIHIMGGVLAGIGFPINLMSQPEIPFVWDDVSGPRGGHEILLTGYLTVGSERIYELISWGQKFRIPEGALLEIIDEATVVLDPVSMDARGTTAAGYNHDQLVAAMAALKG